MGRITGIIRLRSILLEKMGRLRQAEYNLFTVSEAGLERRVGYVKAQKQPRTGVTLIAGFEPASE